MRLGPALNVCIRCYDCDRRHEIAHPRERDHDEDGDDEDECARQNWCDPAGVSPAQVRSSVRLVASVAWSTATLAAKRTQRLHGVWD
jgi:hypothetical protein